MTAPTNGTDWRKAYKGKSWTGPECMDGRILRVVRVRQGTVEGKSTNIAEAESGGERKDWLLCKTNAACMAAMFGDSIEGWAGKDVSVYFDPTVRFGAEAVGGIRIGGSPQLTRVYEVRVTQQKKKVTYTLRPTEALISVITSLGLTLDALDAATPEGSPKPSAMHGPVRVKYASWLQSPAAAERIAAARAHLTPSTQDSP